MEQLRDVLHEARVTQAQAEERAGMPRKYLSRLMNGQVGMKLTHLYDVLEALNVEPRDFFARLGGYQPREPLDDVLRRLAALEKRAGGGS